MSESAVDKTEAGEPKPKQETEEERKKRQLQNRKRAKRKRDQREKRKNGKKHAAEGLLMLNGNGGGHKKCIKF